MFRRWAVVNRFGPYNVLSSKPSFDDVYRRNRASIAGLPSQYQDPSNDQIFKLNVFLSSLWELLVFNIHL